MPEEKTTAIIISIYKIFMNIFRIALGTTILIFGANTQRLIEFFSLKELVEDPRDIIAHTLTNHVRTTSFTLTLIFALILIILSLAELSTIFALIYRKKWGAIGLFVISILWFPVEILFFSKFLAINRILSFAINIVILIFLYRLIRSNGKYFKNNKK